MKRAVDACRFRVARSLSSQSNNIHWNNCTQAFWPAGILMVSLTKDECSSLFFSLTLCYYSRQFNVPLVRRQWSCHFDKLGPLVNGGLLRNTGNSVSHTPTLLLLHHHHRLHFCTWALRWLWKISQLQTQRDTWPPFTHIFQPQAHLLTCLFLLLFQGSETVFHGRTSIHLHIKFISRRKCCVTFIWSHTCNQW